MYTRFSDEILVWEKRNCMRLIVAALILTIASPAFAANRKSQCKSKCDSNYSFCMNRATTKQAKKACKSDRKGCKSGCH